MFRPSEIAFYTDLMIIEAMAPTSYIEKKAGMTSDLIAKVKEYVGNNIDPNDKVGSLFNILGPGAIALTFRAMDLGWIGMIIGFAMRAFHIDVGQIISSIWTKLKSALGQGAVSSAQVENAVTSSVQEHAGTDASDPVKSSSEIMHEARFLKLALADYEKSLLRLTKEAAPIKSPWSSRSGTSSVLGTLLSVLFKVALASAGLMVAGDVVNKFIGRPNALDGSVQRGRPANEQQATVSRSKQTVFPVNPSYHVDTHPGTWSVAVVNEPSAIENMLVNFAKEVYSGLNGHESAITSSPTFQKIKSDIIWYNHASAGDNAVIIPKEFTSKKDLVDYFIDDVANSLK